MAKRKAAAAKSNEAKPACGIVMPISERDGCSSHHWLEVLSILTAAAEEAGYDAKLVSNAEHIGIIHHTIVENLYDNPIVICDVSTENPNVMFELGLRLAFDKPTIVVIDDKTKISFDASPIMHLTYPRDLRFSSIVQFQDRLADAIKATIEKFEKPDCVTFLRSFKKVTAAKLESVELPSTEIILREIASLRRDLTAAPSASKNSFTREEISEISRLTDDPMLQAIAEACITLATTRNENGVLISQKDAVQRLQDSRDFKSRVPASVSDIVAIKLIRKFTQNPS